MKAATDGIEFTGSDDDKCVICVKGKQTRAPFGESEHPAKGVLDNGHHSQRRCIYVKFSAIIQWCGMFRHIHRRLQSEGLPVSDEKQKGGISTFLHFKNFVENQTGRKIKTLRTDNGTEYATISFNR